MRTSSTLKVAVITVFVHIANAGTTTTALSGTASNFNPFQATLVAAQAAVYRCPTPVGDVYMKYAYGATSGSADYVYFYPVGSTSSTTECTVSTNPVSSGWSQCVFFTGTGIYGAMGGRWSLYLGSATTLAGSMPLSITGPIATEYDCDNTTLQAGVTPAMCKASYTCTKM